MHKRRYLQRSALFAAMNLAVLPLVGPVWAQVAPDAGSILQQLQPSGVAPRESRPLDIQAPTPLGSTPPGGAEVVLQAVSYTGNSAIDKTALQAALGEIAGKSFDLAGLRNLADRIGNFYRASGYPFARAVLPPQGIEQGNLRIEIIEGRYGAIKAQSEEASLAMQAQKFLSSLKPGNVIESAELERIALLLSDQPGIKTQPVVGAGTDVGTGDLMVQVDRDKRVTGDVGLDNAGGRYTGQLRIRANLNINSPFMLGDQIRLNTLLSEERLWLGAVTYGLPLGGSGLRGTVGYSQTSYTLGKEFANLRANGMATVSSAGLSYPLFRSQKANLTVSGTYQAKNLQDNRDSTNTHEAKTSTSLPVVVQFDNRDSLGGGGITYGSVGWTPGNLTLDSALEAADTNNTHGRFSKINLDLVRFQALPSGFSLMMHMNLQHASKNLDSSEKMSLGGSGGVRAYPSGEGSGDEGALVQLELRYSAGAFAPYVFWDAGSVRTNARPAAAATNNKRSLSGAGLGLRYQGDAWNADVVLAWRSNLGGAPQADTNEPTPRIWANVAYRF